MDKAAFSTYRAHVLETDTYTGVCRVRLPGVAGLSPLLVQADGNAPDVDSMAWVVASHDFSQIFFLPSPDVSDQPGEPNGFEDRTECVLSWDDGTRTLTLTPADFSYTFWSDGNKYRKTGDSITITDVEGEHFIYYDENGFLTELVGSFDPDLIQVYCFVAQVQWDATNSEAVPWPFCEQHGSSMSAETHSYLHNTHGSQYASGLAITVNASGDGDSDSHAQFASTAGVMYDEDIQHSVLAHGLTDTLPILYREGVGGQWRKDDSASFLVKTTGTGRAAWNQNSGGTWSLVEVGNNNYVLAHVFALPALNSSSAAVAIVMGQSEYATISQAQAGAEVEIRTLDIDGMPGLEFVAMGTIIMSTGNAYSNSVKSRAEQTDGGSDYIDWRSSATGKGSVSGAAEWGGITGTLSNQLDLQAALDLKADLAGATFTGLVEVQDDLDVTGTATAALFDSNFTLGQKVYLYGVNHSIGVQSETTTIKSNRYVQLFNNDGTVDDFVFDIDALSLQARTGGSAVGMSLNPGGGLVTIGSGGLAVGSGGIDSAGDINTDGNVVANGGYLYAAASSTTEGGELSLYPGTSYSGNGRIDRYQDLLRIMNGSTSMLEFDMTSKDATFSSDVYLTGDSDLVVRGIRTNNGQELVLCAGESAAQEADTFSNEYVYAVAEDGLWVVKSIDNWAGGWSERVEFPAFGMKWCNPSERVYDPGTGSYSSAWRTIDLGTDSTTIGGQALRGATAAFVNITMIASNGGNALVRQYGGSADTTCSIMNFDGTDGEPVHATMWVPLDTGYRFEVYNSATVTRIIVDVFWLGYW